MNVRTNMPGFAAEAALCNVTAGGVIGAPPSLMDSQRAME